MANDHTLERYLYAIMQLQTQFYCVRSVDVAHYLGCSKPSVSASVRQLTQYGWIVMEDDGNLRVTEIGQAHAREILRHVEYFKELLRRAGVEANTANREAFALSQALSDDTIAKLRAYLEDPSESNA